MGYIPACSIAGALDIYYYSLMIYVYICTPYLQNIYGVTSFYEPYKPMTKTLPHLLPSTIIGPNFDPPIPLKVYNVIIDLILSTHPLWLRKLEPCVANAVSESYENLGL